MECSLPFVCSRPITAADFGPKEVQRTPAWPSLYFVDIKSTDFNTLSTRICKVFNTWRKIMKHSFAGLASIKSWLNAASLENVCLELEKWSQNGKLLAQYWRFLSSSVWNSCNNLFQKTFFEKLQFISPWKLWSARKVYERGLDFTEKHFFVILKALSLLYVKF